MKYLKDTNSARQLWKDLIACGHREEARCWLDYANFERYSNNISNFFNKLLKFQI